MRRLLTFLSLTLLLTCAKEDSQAPNTPPSQIVRQYTLTVSAGDGGSVSTTGGSFASGTQVSITATPNSGYSFSGWSNGSTANPLNVTLNSNTTVTANFQVIVNSYTLTVSTGDGGSVSSEGGEYEEGTEVTITATPDEGYEFVGWSDGETSISREVTISSDTAISASFQIDCSVWYNEVPDWKSTSYELFEIYYPENYDVLGSLLFNQWGGESGEYGLNVISVDYNNDGYKDIIGYYNDYSNFIDYPEDYYGYERKQPIRFYKGSCGGSFEVDTENDNKYLGLVHGRKILLGDFNDDGFVDLFFVGHGYDKPPYNGEFNKVLVSDGNGSFLETEFTDYVSFYHGGTTGDYDNDGDLDVFLIDLGRGKSLLMTNNNGTFDLSTSKVDQDLMIGQANTEMYDFNNDGFLDIIIGGQDWTWNQNPNCEWWDCLTYNNTPLIIYGDGQDFVNNEYVRLPESSINGQGIPTHFEIFDIDNNGDVEIIVIRTGDDTNEERGLPWNETNFYRGWSIQIIENLGGEYVDNTEKYIDIYFGNQNWIRWTDIKDYDNDGIIEMVNSENPYRNPENYLEWEIIGGKFIKND
ncbi:MAG: VCBS repeat-containing protein [Cryomorphaceae bacterium]|jgi:hypothetical protein|nr:VCBS repeat-containing protein [Cryomorphaceae bacterium]MBT5541357.1 VCBS repeat-containing protein [Gammaproteobacteria bacterium]MBT6214202.1 VCBS repeat-containing protein [Cryomorphaceae bacterium]